MSRCEDCVLWEPGYTCESCGTVQPHQSDAPRCHFCAVPVTEKPMHSKCGTAVAHFECWYEGAPFYPEKRDPLTGKLAPLTITRP